MKKGVRFTAIAVSVLAIAAVGWHFYTPAPNNSLPVTEVISEYIYDVSDKREIVGASDYVFVGTVERFDGYTYKGEMPYTSYTVTVAQVLKGNLPAEASVTVRKQGGVSRFKLSAVIADGDDFFPDAGQTCMFAVCADTDGALTAPSPNRVIAPVQESLIAEYLEAVQNEVQNEAVKQMWEARSHTGGTVDSQ